MGGPGLATERQQLEREGLAGAWGQPLAWREVGGSASRGLCSQGWAGEPRQAQRVSQKNTLNSKLRDKWGRGMALAHVARPQEARSDALTEYGRVQHVLTAKRRKEET